MESQNTLNNLANMLWNCSAQRQKRQRDCRQPGKGISGQLAIDSDTAVFKSYTQVRKYFLLWLQETEKRHG